MIGAVGGIFSPVVATAINNGITILIGVNAIKPLWNNSDGHVKEIY
jgi:Cu2+-exporting ATPase